MRRSGSIVSQPNRNNALAIKSLLFSYTSKKYPKRSKVAFLALCSLWNLFKLHFVLCNKNHEIKDVMIPSHRQLKLWQNNLKMIDYVKTLSLSFSNTWKQKDRRGLKQLSEPYLESVTKAISKISDEKKLCIILCQNFTERSS